MQLLVKGEAKELVPGVKYFVPLDNGYQLHEFVKNENQYNYFKGDIFGNGEEEYKLKDDYVFYETFHKTEKEILDEQEITFTKKSVDYSEAGFDSPEEFLQDVVKKQTEPLQNQDELNNLKKRLSAYEWEIIDKHLRK